MEYILSRPKTNRLPWIFWVILAFILASAATQFAMNPNNEVKIVPCSKCVGCSCPRIPGTMQCMCPR